MAAQQRVEEFQRGASAWPANEHPIERATFAAIFRASCGVGLQSGFAGSQKHVCGGALVNARRQRHDQDGIGPLMSVPRIERDYNHRPAFRAGSVWRWTDHVWTRSGDLTRRGTQMASLGNSCIANSPRSDCSWVCSRVSVRTPQNPRTECSSSYSFDAGAYYGYDP
jgi:hypothetical protein